MPVPWKAWCFCIVSLEKDFRMSPRNLFLVFTPFLIWYNHCLSGPLQLRSCVLGSIPPSSKAHTHLRQLQVSQGADLRRHLQRTAEMWCSWPWSATPSLEGNLRLPVPNVLSQGQSRHLHHEFAYNHSYLQSTCRSSPDPYPDLVKLHI